jgi:hypothetical protein
MSPPGRPKGEFPSEQREGCPMLPPGRPKGEFPSEQREGCPMLPPGRPKGASASAQHVNGPASRAGIRLAHAPPRRGVEGSPRRRALQRAAALVLAGALAPLRAQPAAAPLARLRLALDGAAARRLEIGEALVVRLEVWVSTWFQAPVDFPATLEAGGALVEAVGGSPESRFEEFDGRRWTGLVRRYRLLPAQPGELRVALSAPLPVQPGGGPLQRLAPPAPLRLTVSVPAGAEDIQPFVAARRLELRQRWWPEGLSAAATAHVGDLIRREIVLVTDSAAPLLPAPDFGAPAGAGVRVQAAQTSEQRADAATTATLTRSQQAVYTLQAAGSVTLPPVEFVWWDLTQRRRRVSRLDGLTLEVQPAAARADPFAPAAAAAPASAAPAGASATGAAALTALLAGGALAAGVALWRRRARGAVPAGAAAPGPIQSQAWRRLRRACRRGDATAADRALRDLLAALDAPTRQRWLQDAALAQARVVLGRHRFGAVGTGAPGPYAAPVARLPAGWDGAGLLQAVQSLRRAAAAPPPSDALPTLHP